MRVAIISDVHADVHALNDALAQTVRLGCHTIVCAGDIVDYGLFPQETIDLLIARGIPCIRGNHDRWAVGRGRADAPNVGPDTAPRDATGWDLTPDAVRFLSGLPSSWNSVIEGVRVAVHHARPGSDMDGIYPDQASPDDARRWLDSADTDVLLVGHTHIAFALTSLDGRLVANPGALLREPGEGHEERARLYDPESGTFAPGPAPGGGTFGILDLPSKRFTVHRASDGVEIAIPHSTLGMRDTRAR